VRSIKQISIYGSGQIGKSLSLLFSSFDLDVILISRNVQKTIRELKLMYKVSTKLNKELIFNIEAIKVTSDIKEIVHSDLIIEAVSEDMDTKISVITKINDYINSDTIISSTTSTKSITELASYYKYKENYIGLHFFNPPSLINFIEIIKGEYTSEQTVSRIIRLCDEYSRKYILLEKENPGFIVNRALFLMLNEAIYELYEGLATAKDIDNAFKSGLNHPMGPIELCDFIGLDIVLDILNTLYEEYKDNKYRPCYLLKQKVRAEKYGKKSREGFYKY